MAITPNTVRRKVVAIFAKKKTIFGRRFEAIFCFRFSLKRELWKGNLNCLKASKGFCKKGEGEGESEKGSMRKKSFRQRMGN